MRPTKRTCAFKPVFEAPTIRSKINYGKKRQKGLANKTFLSLIMGCTYPSNNFTCISCMGYHIHSSPTTTLSGHHSPTRILMHEVLPGISSFNVVRRYRFPILISFQTFCHLQDYIAQRIKFKQMIKDSTVEHYYTELISGALKITLHIV